MFPFLVHVLLFVKVGEQIYSGGILLILNTLILNVSNRSQKLINEGEILFKPSKDSKNKFVVRSSLFLQVSMHIGSDDGVGRCKSLPAIIPTVHCLASTGRVGNFAHFQPGTEAKYPASSSAVNTVVPLYTAAHCPGSDSPSGSCSPGSTTHRPSRRTWTAWLLSPPRTYSLLSTVVRLALAGVLGDGQC